MNQNPFHQGTFQISRLELVAPAEHFQDQREPPLRLGDVVVLNSGGPLSLIVDLPDAEHVVVSWRADTVYEREFPRACTYHHVSQTHLKRYVGEFDFRYNNRAGLGVSDAERAVAALKGIDGKRLTYRLPHGRTTPAASA